MKILKNIKTACTFIAVMIGAGFASGQEISLYFASTNILVPVCGAVCCGIFCFIFAELGRISNGNMLPYTLGKFTKPASFIIKLSNAATYCAMLAGCELVIKALFGISGGTVISAALCLIVVYLGEEKIKILNVLSLPLILGLIALILIKGKYSVPDYKEYRLFSPIFYASMNILSAGYIISSLSKDNGFSDSLLTSAFVTVFLVFMMTAIYIIIQDSFDKTMPLLYAASALHLDTAAYIFIYIAIFTTMTGSLLISSGKKIKPAMLVTAGAILIAGIGFKKTVDLFYPLIGWAGAALTLISAVKLISYYYNKRKDFPAFNRRFSDFSDRLKQ